MRNHFSLKKLALALCWLPLLFSCDFFNRSSNTIDPVIAQVGEATLHLSDLAEVLVPAKTEADSQRIIENYTDNWIKRKLILDKAQTYLPEEQLDIEKQIADYRESLLIYAYENELIKQKMDTSVTNAEVRAYYNSNLPTFELSEDIVQFYYVKIPLQAPKLDSARVYFKQAQEGDKNKLVEYCYQYAEDFYLKDSLWYELNDIYKQVPIEILQLRAMAMNSLSGEVEDEQFLYLLKINNYAEQRTQAPLEYVADDIRKIILNRRKMELVSTTYDNLYKDAVKSGSFEKYPLP